MEAPPVVFVGNGELKGRGALHLARYDEGQTYVSCALPGTRVQTHEAEINPTNPESGVWFDGTEDGWRCWVADNGVRVEAKLIEVDVRTDQFDRISGLIETDKIHDTTVAIVGVGSGGSRVALELAMAGVGHFALVDHDRLEIGNVVRHTSGLSDIGRLKVFAVADQIRQKNQAADVRCFPIEANANSLEILETVLADADLVICGTDNRNSRLLVNRLAVEKNQTCLYGGTFQRAYGGQALRVRPGVDPCYQCFIDLFPNASDEEEISSEQAAERVAYADKPVAVEPGLSNDISPMSQMLVTLAIQELIPSGSSGLESLKDDLRAPLYQWLNRRETGTQYGDLSPLDESPDYRILAWYPIDLNRFEDCPTCGDIDKFAAAHLRGDPSGVVSNPFGGEQ